jgi:proliferating cell nuclear antigen
MIEKEQNVPSLTFDTEITMNSAKIEEQIVEADTLAESVVFHVLKDVFDIKAKSDMNELKISNRQENNAMIFSKAEVKSTYSIEYLKKITRSKKISEDVIINFSTDYPLKMKYAEKDKVVLTWILAPRVENI